MRKFFTKKQNKKSKGQSLVEYGLILALVSVVAITVLQLMGTQIKTTVNGVTGTLDKSNKISACTNSGGVWRLTGEMTNAGAAGLDSAGGAITGGAVIGSDGCDCGLVTSVNGGVIRTPGPISGKCGNA